MALEIGSEAFYLLAGLGKTLSNIGLIHELLDSAQALVPFIESLARYGRPIRSRGKTPEIVKKPIEACREIVGASATAAAPALLVTRLLAGALLGRGRAALLTSLGISPALILSQ